MSGFSPTAQGFGLMALMAVLVLAGWWANRKLRRALAERDDGAVCAPSRSAAAASDLPPRVSEQPDRPSTPRARPAEIALAWNEAWAHAGPPLGTGDQWVAETTTGALVILNQWCQRGPNRRYRYLSAAPGGVQHSFTLHFDDAAGRARSVSANHPDDPMTAAVRAINHAARVAARPAKTRSAPERSLT